MFLMLEVKTLHITKIDFKIQNKTDQFIKCDV